MRFGLPPLLQYFCLECGPLLKQTEIATSNNVEKILPPLQSRFLIVKLEPYTYEQFYDITVRLLTASNQQYNVDEEIAIATCDAVWNISSKSIRDLHASMATGAWCELSPDMMIPSSGSFA
jgi:hypothetical protein